MGIRIEKISAVTLKVANMKTSVRFYRDVLGMELLYGGPEGVFSSLRTTDVECPILNLEEGSRSTDWGESFSTLRTWIHSPVELR